MTSHKTSLIFPFMIVGQIMSVILLSGCQEPIDIEDPIDTNVTFDTHTELYDLLYNVTMLDGSEDNILDDGSCIKVILPVSIHFESEIFIVNTTGDFDALAGKMKTYGVNPQDLDFLYPLYVRTAHYEVLSVNDADELEAFAKECVTDGSDADIECIDLKYPIHLSAYNKLVEESSTEEIVDDESFHLFLKGLTSDDVLSINFPVSVTTGNFDLEYTNNSDLFDAISTYLNACDENDDVEFDFEKESEDNEFEKVLKNGDWYIHHYYDRAQLHPELRAFKLKFEADGTISIDGKINASNDWEVTLSEGDFELDISMDDELLSVINMQWKVSEFTNDRIVFRNDFDDDSKTDYLVLSNSQKSALNEFEKLVISDEWEINDFKKGEEDLESDSKEVDFRFSENGQVMLYSSDVSYIGTWFTIFDSKLIIVMDESNLEELNKEWVLSNYSTSGFFLEHYSNGEIFRITFSANIED